LQRTDSDPGTLERFRALLLRSTKQFASRAIHEVQARARPHKPQFRICGRWRVRRKPSGGTNFSELQQNIDTISRLSVSLSHGKVDSMLEAILSLLGVAAGSLILIAFWGTDPLGMWHHR